MARKKKIELKPIQNDVVNGLVIHRITRMPFCYSMNDFHILLATHIQGKEIEPTTIDKINEYERPEYEEYMSHAGIYADDIPDVEIIEENREVKITLSDERIFQFRTFKGGEMMDLSPFMERPMLMLWEGIRKKTKMTEEEMHQLTAGDYFGLMLGVAYFLKRSE